VVLYVRGAKLGKKGLGRIFDWVEGGGVVKIPAAYWQGGGAEKSLIGKRKGLKHERFKKKKGGKKGTEKGIMRRPNTYNSERPYTRREKKGVNQKLQNSNPKRARKKENSGLRDLSP